jgi:hypothetical protein
MISVVMGKQLKAFQLYSFGSFMDTGEIAECVFLSVVLYDCSPCAGLCWEYA